MKPRIYKSTLLIFIFISTILIHTTVNGQFISTPPTLNGTISANEYGATGNGTNQITNGAVTTYMTWDATNLYIAVSGASVNEATIIYIDKDNLIPVNGGGIAQGVAVGQSLDNTNFANLPYRSDLLLYARNGLFQYYTNNLGSWSLPSSLNMTYSDNGLTTSAGVKEFSIAWSVIGGRPGSFNFFGYNTDASGTVYNTFPSANASGTIGTTARFERYFSVTSTTNGSSTLPFSRDSYVFNNTVNETSFGVLNVFDFTMNSPGLKIIRSPSSGAWNITGTMYDNAGTVDFGNSGSFGATNVANLSLAGGTLSLNQTNLPINISGNVTISSGTFSLSSIGGGDLNLGGNFTNSGGTFLCNGRQVTFNGTNAQSLSSSVTETIDLLSVQNTSAAVSILSSVNVGKATTNSFNIAPFAFLFVNAGTFTVQNKALGTIDGSLVNKGASIVIPFSAPNTAVITVSSVGKYIHNMDGGTIPSLTWATGSTCYVTGWGVSATLLGGLTQSFSNFTWNSPSQTAAISFASTLTTVRNTLTISSTGLGSVALADITALNLSIGNYTQTGGSIYIAKGTALPVLTITGDFNMSGGTLDFNILNSATGSLVSVAGNLTFSAGTITHTGSGGNGSFVFNGTTAKNINCTPSVSKCDFQINNGDTAVLNSNITLTSGTMKLQTGGTLVCGTYIVFGNSFIQQTGSTLKTASLDAGGALTSSAASGSIQTSSRTYHSGGTYEFYGSNVQNTGDFTAFVVPVNTVANLKINNASTTGTSGVNLSTPIIVTGTLNMVAGKITPGTFTLQLSSTCTVVGGSSTSYIDGALTVNYPANLTGITSYLYPIGSGINYYPFGLLNVRTGATGPSITLTSFNVSAGGTTNAPLTSLSGSEYWSAVVNSGSFSSASIQLGRGITLGANNAIGASSTKTGVYSNIGKTVVSTSSLSSSVQNSLGYYSLATLQPSPIITVIQPVSVGGIFPTANSGYAGQTINIKGSNFTLSNMTVKINGVTPSFTLTSTTLITAIVPAGIVSDSLIVKNTLTGDSAIKAFKYNGLITNSDGDWNTNTTWLHNAVPISSTGDTITINNIVGVSSSISVTPKLLQITSGHELNFTPPGATTISLSIQGQGKLINQGSITMNDNSFIQMLPSTTFDNSFGSYSGVGNSYLKFFDKSTLIGPINANNISIADTVNFSGDITINGYLKINFKSGLKGVAPIYANNSTLKYDGAASSTFYPTLEWSSNSGQPGQPYNVSIGIGQFTSVNLERSPIPLTILGTLGVFNGMLTLGNSPYPLTVNDDLTIGFSSSIALSSIAGGDLIVKSNFKNLGSFTGNNRTVIFNNQTKDQTVDCQSQLDLGGLKVDKGSYKLTFLVPSTANRIVTISNTFDVTSGTVDLNNLNFVLKSTSINTAAITNILGTVLNATNITAERFVPAHRAWVMMGVPVLSNQTINAAWQEGQTNTTMTNSNIKPGYGTHIGGVGTINGFDLTVTNNPSLKYYTSASDSWTGVSNTNVLKMSSQPGYMLFMRGSRAVNLSQGVNAIADNTTLEVNGSLKQGDQSTNIGVATNKFILISNPYPCTIDFHSITRPAALGDKFSVWDPYLTGNYGVGGFVTFTWDGFSSYVSSISGYSAGLGRYIQSGQAFMVQGTGNLADNIVIKESDKVSTNTSSIFSPLGPTTTPEQLRVCLSYKNPNSSYTLVDGALAIFNDQFENGLDPTDAAKINNFRENIYFTRGEDTLAIEARKIIQNIDTLFLHFSAFEHAYQLSLISQNLNHPGLIGILNDNFTKTNTPLNLSDTTNYYFSVTSDPASKAGDRFSITFKKEETLPVTFTDVNAQESGDNIKVNWSVQNQRGIKNYTVEKSEDGTNFYKLETVEAINLSTPTINYSYIDNKPFETNFYRIVSHGFNGETIYSRVVKVLKNKEATNYAITPNPIQNGIVNIRISNLLKGLYEVRLLNNGGQTIATKSEYKNQGSMGIITLDKKIAHGSYIIQIIDPNKQSQIIKVVY